MGETTIRQPQVGDASGNDRKAGWFVPLRDDLREYFCWRKPDREGKSKLLAEIVLYLLRYFLIGHSERSLQPRNIRIALIDTVFLDLGRVSANDVEESPGENAVGFIVGWKKDRIGAELQDIRKTHGAGYAHGLGFVAHGSDNTALLSRDDRFSFQLGIADCSQDAKNASPSMCRIALGKE